ncbi:3-isopropylmalate dehydratase small subunit [Planktothrix paucivesiculata]|uniref:3-isopropylmalate dehydratase small subunit n=1 Tax=Planktothrix paucivesiculata PCC 9631 TaxID=671071 RepID=A0A7Z9BI94_9CYAN|nr:3-isopropylmalate dehydratase small subunit [Planktothrix paucivesiculata]VXD14568.1 3-isopropylmalate dehydratase small subunit [Planktothrix paucivesiculata PCC 9631]
MSKIQSISGTGIPLVGSDIDTDRIIPARFLRCVTFDGLGEQVFADDRQQMQGKHAFDLPEYQGANLLVVNANFGCGSSREHAPQAIAKWGIKGIIGESFAEIFLGNCVSIGIPCVSAEPEDIKAVQEALKANPKAAINLDLESMKVHCGEFTIDVNMNAGSRQSFITGLWDSCGQLIDNFDQIRATATQLPYLNWGS